MWANAQRDGHPAEYRSRPVLNAAKFGSRPLLKCRAVTLPKYERARLAGYKVNFARGKNPRKWICSVPAHETAKVWLASVERRQCSNAAKTRNPLTLIFVGVPQTTGPISAACGPKFSILWGHVEEIGLLLLNF